MHVNGHLREHIIQIMVMSYKVTLSVFAIGEMKFNIRLRFC